MCSVLIESINSQNAAPSFFLNMTLWIAARLALNGAFLLWKNPFSQAIHDTLQPDRDGVSLFDIQQTAESFDLQASAYATSLDHLRHLTGPFIAHVDGNHFVVVYRVTKNKLRIADPATGLETVSLKSFASRFIQGEGVGHILMLSPGKNFRKRRRCLVT